MKKKFYLAVLIALAAWPMQAQQLYNMDFDSWSKSSGAWNLYAKGAPASDRVWDTANHGLSLLGINGTMPEYRHVAVAGEGKAAVKIVSKNVLWAFVAGNLYTGRFGKIVNFAGAELFFGVPFHGRPKSLSGYAHYIPQKIDYAKDPCLDRKGETDTGYIEVILTDWDKPYHIVTNNEKFIDPSTDPHLIGRAKLSFTKDTGGYIHFDIPIEYRNGKTPKYVVITATSSQAGAYFTGADGSTLYLDEFRFNY